MDVYHNGNFLGTGLTGTDRRRTKLKAIPVHRTFLWEGQELFIPALYTGRAGAVLDVCAKIPVEEMAAFLRKWPKKRRLSLKTPQDYEQIDADNPSCRNFLADMSLDDMPLKLGFSSSINWYPEPVFRMGNENPVPAQDDEWSNDKAADMLMTAYGCDRESCWHFVRLSFHWIGTPILSPHKATLDFRAQQIPVTAGHFTTITNTAGELRAFIDQPTVPSSVGHPMQPLPSSDLSTQLSTPISQCRQPSISAVQPDSSTEAVSFPAEISETGIDLKIIHPVTGREYTVTLYECRQTRHSFAGIGAEGVLYPEYCHMLSYRVSPEISRELFDIRDCAEGDHPRKAETPEESCSTQGAAAVFLAGKSDIPEMRMAASSMHFEPVSEIKWRMVFQVQTKANRKILITDFPSQSSCP